jgi:hypothetical protein
MCCCLSIDSLTGEDHLGGYGKLVPTSCSCVLEVWIPHDLLACPYVIVASWGKHDHPPPTPDQIPEPYITEIIDVLRRSAGSAPGRGN